jgi:hypothetical protein
MQEQEKKHHSTCESFAPGGSVGCKDEKSEHILILTEKEEQAVQLAPFAHLLLVNAGTPTIANDLQRYSL